MGGPRRRFGSTRGADDQFVRSHSLECASPSLGKKLSSYSRTNLETSRIVRSSTAIPGTSSPASPKRTSRILRPSIHELTASRCAHQPARCRSKNAANSRAIESCQFTMAPKTSNSSALRRKFTRIFSTFFNRSRRGFPQPIPLLVTIFSNSEFSVLLESPAPSLSVEGNCR